MRTLENPTPARRPVTEEDLRAVLSGYTPLSVPLERGPRLNGRYYPAGQRRCAYDFVFSAHKSVSIAALCLPDQHIGHAMAVRKAWVGAIHNALAFMETFARRGGGRGIDIATNSLLVAGFNHYTSRRNDPQLHTHLLTANATFDTTGEGPKKWYSLEPVQLFKALVQIDMAFQRELVRHLRASGLEAHLKKVDNRVVAALPAVDAAVCRRLSQAHAEILRATEGRWQRDERTLRDHREEDRFNDRTRPSKAGLLGARTEAFERALSAKEVEQIVRRMGTPLSPEQLRLVVPKRPPSARVMDRLILDAATRLEIGAPTLKEVALTALVASKARMDVPFGLFYEHAVERTAILRTEASNEASLQACLDARDRFWREEYDLYGVSNPQKPCLRPREDGMPPLDPFAVRGAPAQAPGPERAGWVAETAAEREQLRDRIERGRLAGATAARWRAGEQGRAADGPEVNSSDSPPASPMHPSVTPGGSSPPAHNADPSRTSIRKRPENSPASAPNPPPSPAPAVPLPDQPNPVPAPDEPPLSEPGVEPYLLPPEETRPPGLRGP